MTGNQQPKRELTPLERMAYEIGFNSEVQRRASSRRATRREIVVTDDLITMTEEILEIEEYDY